MEHLKELRERRGLYQKDVAAVLKIDRTTYVKYETGASEPSFEILKRIARFYEVSIDYLLDYDVGIQKTKKKPRLVLTADEEQLLSAYRDFNEKGKEKIREEIYMMTVSGIYKNSGNVSGMDNKGGAL